MRGAKPSTVDEYLASVPSEEARAALSRLRTIILDEVPEALEGISYGIPGYKLEGYLAGFAAFKNHCSFFPGGSVDEFADRLGGYKLSKGTIQFTTAEPIPEELVREILRFRLGQNRAAKEERRSRS